MKKQKRNSREEKEKKIDSENKKNVLKCLAKK